MGLYATFAHMRHSKNMLNRRRRLRPPRPGPNQSLAGRLYEIEWANKTGCFGHATADPVEYCAPRGTHRVWALVTR